MNYYTFLVTFICVATSRIICVSSVNSSSSANLWKTSTASTIQEMLEKFNSLNIYQTVCSKPEYPSDKLYCQEFIKEDNDYFTLKQVLETKMNEVQRMLAELLALERKAIACRGMRYLLAMNIYGAFASYASDGSTGKADVSEKDIFDDMFRRTEPEPDATGSDRGRDKIEKIRRIVKGEHDTTADSNDPTTGRGRETVVAHGTHDRGLVRKTECVLRAIRPFFADPDDYGDLERTIDAITADAGTSRSPCPSVFRAVNGVYARECVRRGADAAALLGPDGADAIVRKDYSAAGLAEKVDRLFEEVRRDVGTLYVRCYYANNRQRFARDVSMMYFHAFNKYHDPAVWRLIGDEAVVAAAGGPNASLDDVASATERRIDRVSRDLRLSVYGGLRCRCAAYVCAMVRLRYHVVRALAANAREVQRLAAALSARRRRFGECVGRFARDGARRVAATMTLDEYNGVFDEIHGAFASLGAESPGVGGRASDGGDDALPDSDAVSAAIDRLNRDATVGDEFKCVFFIYTMYDWYLINESVGEYQSRTEYFDVEFVPMLRDLKQTAIEADSKTVERILKWYKWGLRTYRDNCNSSIRIDTSGEVQLTLVSIILKMDELYSNFDGDMEKMGKLFHL